MTQETDLSVAYDQLKDLEAIEVPEQSQLPFELLSGRNKKTTKLLANSGSNSSMSGSNRWYDFEFTEPVFLNQIVVSEENYSVYNDFEFRWALMQGGEVSRELSKTTNGVYSTQTNQLVRSVSFRPPQKWLTDTKINRVQLFGFKSDELEDFVRLAARMDDHKLNIVAQCESALEKAENSNQENSQLESKKDELNKEISEENQKILNLNGEVGRLTEQRQALTADIASREDTISALEGRRDAVQEEITERRAVRESLAKDVAQLKQELRALEDDVNMFPTEIGAFVSQGGQSIKTYWRLATVPIALLILVTGLLVFNAANLTTVFDENEDVNVWSILLTRLPYVLIATAIITASYKLARVFVAEIMRINQQRLNLSKISIIATDASNTSQDGLTDLSDRDLYELRTDLKMQLLRDHLKEYLSHDFRYQGKTNSSWGRLLKSRLASVGSNSPKVDSETEVE